LQFDARDYQAFFLKPSVDIFYCKFVCDIHYNKRFKKLQELQEAMKVIQEQFVVMRK